MKALIPYQRKSGDASTFLGNTLFLMAVICDRIPVRDLQLALFSGDDSLLYGDRMDKYKDTQHFALRFNLEVKFFSYEHSYFCSKFLLPVNGKWRFTPDPLKLFTKLGRRDLVNEAHIEEYRVSFQDNCKNFADFSICERVAVAVCERYGIHTNFTEFFASIPSLFDREIFQSLFYREPDALIDGRVYFNCYDF